VLEYRESYVALLYCVYCSVTCRQLQHFIVMHTVLNYMC